MIVCSCSLLFSSFSFFSPSSFYFLFFIPLSGARALHAGYFSFFSTFCLSVWLLFRCFIFAISFSLTFALPFMFDLFPSPPCALFPWWCFFPVDVWSISLRPCCLYTRFLFCVFFFLFLLIDFILSDNILFFLQFPLFFSLTSWH